MHRGYIKLYRKIRDNPRLNNPDYLALWIWLLIESSHKEKKELLGGKTIICNPGQFTTGRKQLSKLSGISESKVERLLNIMEIEQQIEQQKTSTNRLISITNWVDYQQSEQQSEQQSNNDRTHLKNVKNDKNTNKHICSEVYDQSEPTKWGKNFRIKITGTAEEYVTTVSLWINNAPIEYWNELRSDYPNVDIDSQVKEAFIWIKTNSEKRRSKLNVFLNNWFKKAQKRKTNVRF